MTPQEKATELVEKYEPLVNTCIGYFDTPRNHDKVLRDAKQCAFIAVEEIIDILWIAKDCESEYRFWKEVKTEIEKL